MKKIFIIGLILVFSILKDQDEILAETNYQPNLTVDEVVKRLESYTPSGLTNYHQVIDQLFSLESLMDLFSPYYYYSINTVSSSAKETTRMKTVSTYCDPYFYEVAMSRSDGTFEHVACVERFDEAKQVKERVGNLVFEDIPVVLNDGMIVMSFTPAIIQFKTTSCGANHNLKSRAGSNAKQDTYINACYIDDAFLLDELQDDFQVYMSGYDGWISRHVLYDAPSGSETWVNIVPSNQVQNVSYYEVVGEDLVHHISKDVRDELASSSVIIGKAPDFMVENQKYYSYDGNYFYDDWTKITADKQYALNLDDPYYNYFQYLPYRSKTNYSFDELNTYLNELGYTLKPTSYPANTNESQLVGEGESFIAAQEEFGINGGLEFSMALHESGQGRSKISIEKNNTFGMNATDNNPYGNATMFTSVRNGVYYHAQRYMSWGYTDALDDFRYFGAHVGNKASGMNVKYASDPYWGEKIAGWYYRMDKALGGKDYNYYQLAIKLDNEMIPVLSDDDKTVYLTANGKSNLPISNYPFLVLERGDELLKIQSDMAIEPSTQQALINSNYVFKDSAGYVDSNDLLLVNETTINNPTQILTYLNLGIGDSLPIRSALESLGYHFEAVEIDCSIDGVIEIGPSSITALNPGLVQVSILHDGEIIGSFDIRVSIPVESVEILNHSKALKVGKTMQLEFGVTPSNASNQQVMWISSDDQVATVDQNGFVQGVSPGDVTITLLSDDSGVKSEIKIQIKE